MKLLLLTPIALHPDPVSGATKSPADRLRDVVDRSSALMGSPQQVIDKVSRCHQQLGHEVIHLSADADGVTVAQKRRSLELFQSDVAPVLRDQIASRPLAAQSSRKEVVL